MSQLCDRSRDRLGQPWRRLDSADPQAFDAEGGLLRVVTSRLRERFVMRGTVIPSPDQKLRQQHFLRHASITNTVRYTAMSPQLTVMNRLRHR
jgi:hypothetical protein